MRTQQNFSPHLRIGPIRQCFTWRSIAGFSNSFWQTTVFIIPCALSFNLFEGLEALRASSIVEGRWPVGEPRESPGPLCASREMERNEGSVSDWTMADVPAAQAPLISVIVLYFRRRDTIEKVISSILCQDFPRREIVV